MKFMKHPYPSLAAKFAGICLTSCLVATLHASQIDSLVENVSGMGDGGLDEAKKSAKAHAASDGGQLGHHSMGLEEQRFSGNYTLPELPEGEGTTRAAGPLLEIQESLPAPQLAYRASTVAGSKSADVISGRSPSLGLSRSRDQTVRLTKAPAAA